MNGFFRLLAVAGMVSAVGGYWVGLQNKHREKGERRIVGDDAGGRGTPLRDGAGAGRSVGPSAMERGDTVLTKERREALKERLWRSYLYSASEAHDFLLKKEVAEVLAGFSNRELEDYAREMAERADLFGEFAMIFSDDRRLMLLNEILRVWGSRDPAAACATMPGVWAIPREGILRDWLKRDSNSAERWIREIPLSEDGVWSAGLRCVYLSHLAAEDLSAAGTELALMDEEMKERMLGLWSRAYANQPDKRAEVMDLLNELGNERVARDGRRNLLDGLARNSPGAAYDFLETLDLPREEAAELRDFVFHQWAKLEPKNAFEAWAESGPEAVSEQVAFAMMNWGTGSMGAEPAIEWLANLEVGAVREKLEVALAQGLAGENQFSQAAKVAEGMAPSIERTRMLKTLHRSWGELASDAEAQWRAGLSKEDQALLAAPLE